MKNIITRKTVFRSKVDPFIYLLFIFLSVFFVMKGKPYFFLITLLAISSNFKDKIYLFNNIVSLGVSLILSINSFYMVLIIDLMFFMFKIFSNIFVKKNMIRRNFAYVSTSLTVFLFYMIKDFSYVNFTNLFLLLSISFLCFYAFHKVLDNYQYSLDVIDSKDRIIIYTITPFLFAGLELFYLMIVRLIHLILIKSAKFSEGLASIILSSFLFVYFLNVSQVDVLLLVLPFLFASVISKKHSLLVYMMFYILSNVFLKEKFYIEPLFYQGLLSIIIALLINESFYINLTNLLIKHDADEIKESKDIQDIVEYLSLVLENGLDNIRKPLDHSFNELKSSLCLECEKFNKCKLNEIIKKGIEEKYSKEERQLILDQCANPYKLFKRTQVYSDIYLKEKDKIENSMQVQNIYKKELENLYYPLKKAEEKDIDKFDRMTYEIKNEGYKLIDCKVVEKDIEVELFEYHKDDEEFILTIIENVYRKSFRFIKVSYSFALGGYILLFSSRNVYKTDISTYSSSMDKESTGDKLLFYEKDNKFILYLSDGMGHDKEAAYLSSYLVDSLNLYSKIDSSLSRQIETVNRLLYHKTNFETYATLDYFILDLINLNFTLFKAGSFPTYIYHNGKLKESKKNFTPLGILEKVNPFAFKDVLNQDDIVVIMSDGFGEDVYDILFRNINQYHEYPSSELAKFIYEELVYTYKIQDDKTLVVIKIEKVE